MKALRQTVLKHKSGIIEIIIDFDTRNYSIFAWSDSGNGKASVCVEFEDGSKIEVLYNIILPEGYFYRSYNVHKNQICIFYMNDDLLNEDTCECQIIEY